MKNKLNVWGCIFFLAMAVVIIVYWIYPLLLKSRMPVKVSSPDISALTEQAQAAIKRRDYLELRRLLRSDSTLANNGFVNKKTSLLDEAIYWKDEVAVQMLLEHGADPDGGHWTRPLEEALSQLNDLSFDAPEEIQALRPYIPAEMERIRTYLKKDQVTRVKIILHLLQASADYNFKTSALEGESPSFFEGLVLHLCKAEYYDRDVLKPLLDSDFTFYLESKLETNFRNHIFTGMQIDLFNRECVSHMYNRVHPQVEG